MISPGTFISMGLAVLAGASVALQQVLNAQLRTQLASPWWAGFVSYCVGMLAMLVVALCVPGPRLSLAGLSDGAASALAWTGGIFGAIFIATGILMVPRLGASTTLTLVVLGQMAAALVMDHFGVLGLPVQSVTFTRLAGVVLLVLGVVLIRRV